MRERICWIDIAKALGIALVIYGHQDGCPPEHKRLIYTFHMPLFFFLGGCLASARPGESLAGELRRLAANILLPYAVLYLVLYIVWVSGQRFFMEDKVLHTPWWEPLLGFMDGIATGRRMAANPGFWFFTCYFSSLAVFAVIRRVQHPLLIALFVTAASGAGLLLARVSEFRLPWNLESALVALVFVYAGHLVLQHLPGKAGKPGLVIVPLAASLCVGIWLSATPPPELNMQQRIFPAPLAALAYAFAGISLTVSTALAIGSNRVLENVGRGSLVYYALHALVSFCLSGFCVFVLGYDREFKTGNLPSAIVFTLLSLVILYPPTPVVLSWLASIRVRLGKRARSGTEAGGQ